MLLVVLYANKLYAQSSFFKLLCVVYSAVKAGDFAEKGWQDSAAYSTSKLGNVLLARAYQHDFDSSAPERDITVNSASYYCN